MTIEPVFFTRPEGAPIQLRTPPRLASWNVAGHPDQLRLAAALDDAEELLAPTVGALSGPLALRLDVGLADHIPLLDEHDLDNYAFPLAVRLTSGRRLPIVSVWSTKEVASASLVRCEPANPVSPPEVRDYQATVRTTASASTKAYKQQISDQLTDAPKLTPGPVTLELAFVVGPRRNWLNLWKPTIDALDRLLGCTRPDREWHPSDGRIVELGLHCTVDETIGNDVLIAILASARR